MIPGIEIGTTEEPLKQPALPKEVPSPGLPDSMSTTSCPLRSRKLAAVTPTIPAPITPTVFLAPAIGIAPPALLRRCCPANAQIVRIGADKIKSRQ